MAPFTLSFADRLPTVREVAAYLHVSTRTVYTLREDGHIPHVRIANAIRVQRAAVVAFLGSSAR